MLYQNDKIKVVIYPVHIFLELEIKLFYVCPPSNHIIHANYELEGLFQRESNGGKLILPIWHNITKQEVQNFSPSLAGKMAMSTAFMTPNEIAEKLNELLDIKND